MKNKLLFELSSWKSVASQWNEVVVVIGLWTDLLSERFVHFHESTRLLSLCNTSESFFNEPIQKIRASGMNQIPATTSLSFMEREGLCVWRSKALCFWTENWKTGRQGAIFWGMCTYTVSFYWFSLHLDMREGCTNTEISRCARVE